MIGSAITVCVGERYAHMLQKSIERWLAGVAELVVVTDQSDEAAAQVCREAASRDGRSKLILTRSGAFTRHGARFNKGAALNEAVPAMRGQDWILLFDADIIPPAAWEQRVTEQSIKPGILYTAKRFREVDRAVIPGNEPAGYFMLFHASDPVVQRRPLFAGNWTHAGNFDTQFARRWPKSRWHWLDLPLIHQGDPGNWFGPGTGVKEVQETFRLRRERGNMNHERIKIDASRRVE